MTLKLPTFAQAKLPTAVPFQMLSLRRRNCANCTPEHASGETTKALAQGLAVRLKSHQGKGIVL